MVIGAIWQHLTKGETGKGMRSISAPAYTCCTQDQSISPGSHPYSGTLLCLAHVSSQSGLFLQVFLGTQDEGVFKKLFVTYVSACEYGLCLWHP